MKLTQLEVTALLHAEWCSTAMGGRMASALLTGGTPVALDSLQHHGLLFWGPLSTELRTLPDATHWVKLTSAGWEAAKQWRIDSARRAQIVGPSHDLYETGDADAPEAIKDRNGEVTLGLCRRCGQGEADLETFCPGPRTDKQGGWVDEAMVDRAFSEYTRVACSGGDEYGHGGNGDGLIAMRAALTAALAQNTQDQHPDDVAVDRFAVALKAKLAEARDKGRGGWAGNESGMQQRLSDMLRDHVAKGDPRDVGNFAMFLHQRGERILPAQNMRGEEVVVEAVGTIRRDADGDESIDWLIEGGICDLPVGTVLLCADRDVTDDEGQGTLYTHAERESAPMDALIERLRASSWRLENLLAMMPAGRPERADIERDLAENRAALALPSQPKEKQS